jgi:GTP cyclohydrolase II
MTNNPAKINALKSEGIKVNSRVPVEIASNAESAGYLLTKAKRMDHLFLIKPKDAAFNNDVFESELAS